MGRDESQLIQRIVEATLSKLNRTLLHVAKYPVGIESHLQKLHPLISAAEKDKIRFRGIYGIGGIGKSTITKACFNIFADEFEGSRYLANVRETSKNHSGLLKLQETLLFDMPVDKNLKISNIHRGINIIRERLCHKSVLLILDDVDELDQLETLARGHEWFGIGSRIIITTRNKHLPTTCEANGIYEVQGLDYPRALELFSWNAFKRNELIEEYLLLLDLILSYANGLPLALEVLGSFLYGRQKNQWESSVQNLKNKPSKKLYDILKISQDALNDEEKAIVLDIACFFVGKDKDYVTQVIYVPTLGLKFSSIRLSSR
ncbi:disease resistance protein Roq1-like [Ziziphus jujuba]|uniref:Disease resistance protein Roq1-like n=1 Tax=Ziziphus jujuba TaxID=326968 RepID=A0ABM4A2X1_ZIZJJ|nr:disease resistance protein Roq1-like [Ziziphus jujuba]